MKVSIVIATYNRATLLKRAIESVLLQTWTDWELIIVDDGSSDGTDEMVAAYIASGVSIVYAQQPRNMGATEARNRGIQLAQGDYIMVWDSDDVLYPDALNVVMDVFAKDASLSIVSAECRQLKGEVVVPHVSLKTGVVTLSQILCKALPACTKIRVARAEVFKQVKYEAKNIDFMVNGYLAEQGTWMHLGVYLGDFYLESDTYSLTSNRKLPNIEKSIQRAKPLQAYLKRFGDMIQEHCPARYAALRYGTAVGCILSSDVQNARTYVHSAQQCDPKLKYLFVYWSTYFPGVTLMYKTLFQFVNLCSKLLVF